MIVRHAIAAGLLVAAGAVLTGCARPEEPSAGSATQSGEAAKPVAPELPPVVLPDLSPLAISVQRQLRERYDAFSKTREDRSTPPPQLAEAYAELGHLLTAAAFRREAELCYRHAQALAPGDMRWPYLLGHAYLSDGDRSKAIQSFERAHELRPTDLPSLVWLAETYLDEGRPEQAGTIFAKALAVQPKSAAALFGAGRAAFARGAHSEAAQHFERALAVDPRATAIHYPLAMAYRALGNRAKFEEHLALRGAWSPDLADPLRRPSGDVLESAVAYEGRGIQALREGNWAAAAAAFRKGLELEPDDAALRYWLGSALFAAGDASGAEREFRAVVSQSPDLAKAHFSLGAVLESGGRRAAAIEEFAAAVADDPKLPEARLRLADALRLTGQLQPSLVHYEEAVTLMPALAEAWIGGGRVLISLERYPRAREWLTAAMRVHPDRKELAELLARVP